MTTISVGTDPELFAAQDGVFYSVHDLIPGTKKRPFRVRNGFIQVDGVAAEFNTDPATTAEEFLFNVHSVWEDIQKAIDVKAPGLRLEATPTATFDRGYFNSLPIKTRELGCTPDYNAYTGEANVPPKTNKPFRTGAGHLHFGWADYVDPFSPVHYELCREVVKQLDAVIFPASLKWDSDEKRRELYGNLGSFRPRTYGVEYRPTSNAYLRDDRIISWCFTAGVACVQLLLDENVKLWAEEDTSDLWYLNKRYGIPLLEL